MKCVCGYEYEETYNNGAVTSTKGDEKFKILSFVVPKNHIVEIKTNEKIKKIAELAACPKCNTIQLLSYY